MQQLDMWVGCVSELVSYFDTCQEDFSDLERHCWTVSAAAQLFNINPNQFSGAEATTSKLARPH